MWLQTFGLFVVSWHPRALGSSSSHYFISLPLVAVGFMSRSHRGIWAVDTTGWVGPPDSMLQMFFMLMVRRESLGQSLRWSYTRIVDLQQRFSRYQGWCWSVLWMFSTEPWSVILSLRVFPCVFVKQDDMWEVSKTHYGHIDLSSYSVYMNQKDGKTCVIYFVWRRNFFRLIMVSLKESVLYHNKKNKIKKEWK